MTNQFMTYMGVGFSLFGMLLFLVSATSLGFGIFLSLGVVVFGMGLVLSYVALKSDPEEVNDVTQNYGTNFGQPLTHLQSELTRNADAGGGNRAFGFVLTSLGIFVLSISGIYGLFLWSWPLFLLGAGFLISGVILYRR